MIILEESAIAQNIYLIPRSYPSSVTVKIIEDEANTTDTYTITPGIDNNYMVLTDVFVLEEDKFYTILLDDGDVYFGRIFCTNQSDYDINNGKYTEREHTNEYIIYE